MPMKVIDINDSQNFPPQLTLILTIEDNVGILYIVYVYKDEFRKIFVYDIDELGRVNDEQTISLIEEFVLEYMRLKELSR